MVDSDTFKLEEHMIPNFFSSEKAEEITHQMNLINQKEREAMNKIIMNALSHMKREDEIISQQATTKIRKQSLNNGSLYKMFISDVMVDNTKIKPSKIAIKIMKRKDEEYNKIKNLGNCN